MDEMKALMEAGTRAWVLRALPESERERIQVESIPSDLLDKLYPNIALLGPNGDNVAAAVEEVLTKLEDLGDSDKALSTIGKLHTSLLSIRLPKYCTEETDLIGWSALRLRGLVNKRLYVHSTRAGWDLRVEQTVRPILLYPVGLTSLVVDGFAPRLYFDEQYAKFHKKFTDFLGLDATAFRFNSKSSSTSARGTTKTDLKAKELAS